MPFTDYLRTQVLTHVFVRSGTYTPATNLYVGAYTSAPTNLGTDGTEVTGGSYARILVAWQFGISVGRVENNAGLTISGMPACTVVALTVHDATTAGNMLAYGILDEPVVLGAGDPLTINTSQLGILLP